MKLKLVLLSILVLLSLVAYQKYMEYSSLKSIDSYDSCIAAKGSLIQESYPSTCITKIGSRFTENIWKKFVSYPYKFSINYPFYADVITKKYNDGTEYYTIVNSGENQQPYLQISIIPELFTSAQSLKSHITKKYKIYDGYVNYGSSPSKLIEFSQKNIGNHEAYLVIMEQKLNSEFNSYELYIQLDDKVVLVVDPGIEPKSQDDKELFDQILTTFKFTD